MVLEYSGVVGRGPPVTGAAVREGPDMCGLSAGARARTGACVRVAGRLRPGRRRYVRRRRGRSGTITGLAGP